MDKLRVQNLALIITERCNLNCAHCLRGGCSNKVMSDEVIIATLSQFQFIGNLTLCGGEPTLALDRLEKIFSYIAENKIYVEEVSITINGTIYSENFLSLMDYIENYLYLKVRKSSPAVFAISWDKFHHNEVERLNIREEYVENVKRYMNNRHFFALRQLEGKLFREGNAAYLDDSLTVPLRPMPIFMTYYSRGLIGLKKFDEVNGRCFIGPLVAVNVDGTVTECDASILNQQDLYNYGNVLENSIEDICLRRNPIIVKPKKLHRCMNKAMKNYITYDK